MCISGKFQPDKVATHEQQLLADGAEGGAQAEGAKHPVFAPVYQPAEVEQWKTIAELLHDQGSVPTAMLLHDTTCRKPKNQSKVAPREPLR